MIVSDHSPCPPEKKNLDSGDFFEAWGGISSLELTLAAVSTGAADRGIDVARLAGWMSAEPARLAAIGDFKGGLVRGRDADLVVWDPDAIWSVDPARLHQRHKLTPYASRELKGIVRATWLKGEKIYDSGRLYSNSSGEVLLSG